MNDNLYPKYRIFTYYARTTRVSKSINFQNFTGFVKKSFATRHNHKIILCDYILSILGILEGKKKLENGTKFAHFTRTKKDSVEKSIISSAAEAI